jgi:hypothetical protein
MSTIMLITLVIVFAVIIAALAVRSGGPRVTTITRTRKRQSKGDER